MLAFTKYKQHNEEVDPIINVEDWYNKCMSIQTELLNRIEFCIYFWDSLHLIWKLAGIFNIVAKNHSISCSVHSCFISRTWRFWVNGTCLTILSLQVALNTSEPRSVLNIYCAIWKVMLQWRSSFHCKEAHFYEWPKSTKSLKFKLIHRQNKDWNCNMHNPPASVTGKFKISTHICYP